MAKRMSTVTSSSDSSALMNRRVAVIGKPNVGKTTILSVFIRNDFEPAPLLRDMYSVWKKRVALVGEKSEDFFLSISADSPISNEKIPKEIANVDGFVFLYSIADRSSFEYIVALRDAILKERESVLFPMVVVGNCLDKLDEREVDEQEAKKWATKFEAPSFEIATRNMKAVNNTFLSLTRLMASSGQEDDSDSDDEKDDSKKIEDVSPSDELKELNQGLVFALEKNQIRVKAGTVEKLVERLTYHTYPDNAFQWTFLLSFRFFTSPAVLLTLLMRRYCISLPPNTHPSDVESFNENKKKPIQLRVNNAMKKWIETYFFDFDHSAMMLTTLLSFAENVMCLDSNLASKKTLSLIKSKLRERENPPEYRFPSPPPKSILPKNFDKMKLDSVLDLDPMEIARQMTIMEGEMYGAIYPTELVNQPWSKKDKETLAPHVIEMIGWFNVSSLYVSTVILKAEKSAYRINLLKHFIKIGKACLELNNFNGLMEILCGLGNTTVFRLKKTWKSLPEKYDQMYTELKEVMSPKQNFAVFRDALHQVNPPCIPHLGLYLTDLTFMEDGSQDYLEGGLINFEKRNMVAEVVREIIQYQQQKYNIQKVKKILEFFSSWENVVIEDEDELWDLSYAIEARAGGGGKKAAPLAPKEKEAKVKEAKENKPKPKAIFGRDTSVYAAGKEITTVEMMKQFEQIALDPKVNVFLRFWGSWNRMFHDDLSPMVFGSEVLLFKHFDQELGISELLSFREVFLTSEVVSSLAQRIISHPSVDEDMQLKPHLSSFMVGNDGFFHQLILELEGMAEKNLSPEMKLALGKAVGIFQIMPVKRRTVQEKERIEKELRVEELTLAELQGQEGYHSVTLGIMKMQSSRRLMGLYQIRRKLIQEADILTSWDRLRCICTDQIMELLKPLQENPDVSSITKLLEENFMRICQDDEDDYTSYMSRVTGEYLESVIEYIAMVSSELTMLAKRFARMIPMLEEFEAKRASAPEDKQDEEAVQQEQEADLTEFPPPPIEEELQNTLLNDVRALNFVFENMEEVSSELEMLLLLWNDPEHEDTQARVSAGLEGIREQKDDLLERFPLVKEKLEDPEVKGEFPEDDPSLVTAAIVRGRAESRAISLDTGMSSPKFSGLKSTLRRDSVASSAGDGQKSPRSSRTDGSSKKAEKVELGTPLERDLYKKFHALVVNNDLSGLEKAFKQHDFDPNFKPSPRIVSLVHLAARNGYLEVLEVLIDHGGLVDGLDHKNLTPLHYATDNGNSECISLLVKKKANIESLDSYQQTPLHFATCRRDKVCLQILLESRANVNARTKKGSTPLHLAAKSGKTDIAAMLIKHGADVNATTSKLITPLHQAAQTGQIRYCLFLLECGADMNCRDIDGQTPVYKATAQRNEDLVRLLIAKGCDCSLTDNLGQSPLHYSISAGDVGLAEVFIERGVPVDITPANGNTSMHLAARNGQRASIELLLRFGADVNSQNVKGLTPLHYAVKNGYTDCVRLLLNKGADVNMADMRGWSALHFSVVTGQIDVIQLLLNRGANVNQGEEGEFNSGTPLHLAAVKGQIAVAQLLMDAGASVNAQTPFGETPLHNASFMGNLDMAQHLISCGAMTRAQTRKGATPLMLSARQGDGAIVHLLLNKDSADVAYMKTNAAVTALHLAAASGNPIVLKDILRVGENFQRHLDIRDDKGQSPLHYAAQFGRTRCCAALLEAGADINARDHSGCTALQLAASQYHKDSGELLLRRSTEVNRIYSKVKPHDFIESQYANLFGTEDRGRTRNSQGQQALQNRMLKRSKSKGPSGSSARLV